MKILCASVIAMLSLSSSADIYQWRDDKGVMHFSDTGSHADARRFTPDRLSTYSPVIPDIPDEKRQRDLRNAARLSEKKKQRIEAEKQSLAEQRKADLCASARSRYRDSQVRSGQVRLDDVRRARERLDRINSAISRYCY